MQEHNSVTVYVMLMSHAFRPSHSVSLCIVLYCVNLLEIVIMLVSRYLAYMHTVASLCT
jgi:hypothetical protein